METLPIDPLAAQAPVRKTAMPNQPLIYTGYALLLLSFFIYVAADYVVLKRDQLTVFFVHYFLAFIYTMIVATAGALGIRKSWRKENISKTIILLHLFLISAYALNRDLPVFANSTSWLCIYLLVASFALLSFHYFDGLPRWVNRMQYFLAGGAMLLYLYLALYVANFYVVGTIGIIVIGVGAHIMVPLLLLIASLILVFHTIKENSSAYYWIGAGILMPLSLLAVFVVVWNGRISEMETQDNQSVLYTEKALPVWVTISQSLKNDWITERILKSELVYTIANDTFSDWEFMPKSVSWDEIKKHDPLVYIASLFSKSSLSAEDRVKIIKAISGGRHQANERLWSGDNLTTSYIVSDIDIYPELRLAYTEKYLTVKNNSEAGRWWGNTQEGIFTFYLPEGSVITSLSLWINGKEEKGILTSKQKAAKAYNTIVGVEQRDPSVVHWQEGNTVTVRVFPCTNAEERKFKIGITSPLQEVSGDVFYRNITFQGPGAESAQETTRVRFIGSAKGVTLPAEFKKDMHGDYLAEHTYNPDFKLSFRAAQPGANRFSFDGSTYSVRRFTPRYSPANLNAIFLDINDQWSSAELETIRPLLDNHTVYVFADESIVQLKTENWDAITEPMLHQNFSLFPFYAIRDSEHSLVVTKGKILSPHLSDFKESTFAAEISKFFKAGNKIKVFNLGPEKSTYISSLRELRGLEFTTGSTPDLMTLLASNTFPQAEESDEAIVLYDANMIITKTKNTGELKDNAPDHLMRLFSYNDVMRKVGSHYFEDDFIQEALVDEAAMAYVVSPVSSLIVLETREDYERFHINDKDKSLHNAAKTSSGAVPEPHEWALIIVFLAFVLYLKFRP